MAVYICLISPFMCGRLGLCMPNINFYKVGYYNILLSLIFFYIDYGLYVFNATQQYFSYIVAVSFILVAEHGVSRKPLICHHKSMNLNFWCLTPLSAIFKLYHGDQF